MNICFIYGYEYAYVNRVSCYIIDFSIQVVCIRE